MGKIADRKFFSLILLTLFFAVKGLSYHSMAHSEEEEKVVCELCEHVILSDISPYNFTTSYQLPKVFAIIDQAIIPQAEIYFPETSALAFNCRPPPSLF